MTSEEKNLIEGLFQRLRQADTNPKDPEAEQLIRAKTAELPSAPYLLVQAVLVQEHALANAQARIAELESRLQNAQAQPASGGGSFLSGVSRFFGNKPQSQATQPPLPQQAPATQQPQTAPPPITVVPQSTPYPSTVNLGPSSGGSFLQSAMATAAGVAGGQLLFQGIEGLIGHNAGPFGPALESRGFYSGGMGGNTGGMGGNTEIVNNYYGADQPAGSEHEHVQSDTGIQNADLPQDQDFSASDDRADLVDADSQDSGLDLGGGDDSGFASDDSFSGSDDNLV
jgi:hypothetical protein